MITKQKDWANSIYLQHHSHSFPVSSPAPNIRLVYNWRRKVSPGEPPLVTDRFLQYFYRKKLMTKNESVRPEMFSMIFTWVFDMYFIIFSSFLEV